MSFAADVRRFSEKSEKAVDKPVRAITFALFREVIQRTPVDTGRLKGNWQVSVGAPADGTLTTTDKSGSKTVVAMAAGIGGWGSTSYLTNNLPYAHRIEFDGWSHTKAPEGMVRVSLARIEAIVAKATRENKA
jgi:hypothetical protein